MGDRLVPGPHKSGYRDTQGNETPYPPISLDFLRFRDGAAKLGNTDRAGRIGEAIVGFDDDCRGTSAAKAPSGSGLGARFTQRYDDRMMALTGRIVAALLPRGGFGG
jgi:hypothetical protein